jgi:hypothetical protein
MTDEQLGRTIMAGLEKPDLSGQSGRLEQWFRAVGKAARPIRRRRIIAVTSGAAPAGRASA